jgi:hypothetical protein
VPIINPDTVPSWMPNGLKTVGSAALKITQQAAEKGLIKRSDPGARFTMKYGVLRGRLDATQSCAVCASTSAAALDTDKPLTNINDAERSRRITAGYSLAAVAVACSAVADLSGAPFNTRLAFALPLALGWAFYESGRTGLWNIAQAGLWDVGDGGLRPVDDPAAAAALRSLISRFNRVKGAQGLAAALVLALVPELLATAQLLQAAGK